MDKLRNKRICVTGGGGFLGKAVCARLDSIGVRNVFVPRRREYDLTQSSDVDRLFDKARPDIILHLAAEVGGIGANERNPGRYFYANMAMGLHLIEASRIHGLEKFVQVGTVCAYPKFCPVPFVEKDLWQGYPEETNAPYGVAKRALSVMLDAYRRQYGLNGVYVIPANLYGPNDNFDLETSHVVPALIRKFLHAVEKSDRIVDCWGTGRVTREFLYVEDAADAVVRAAALLDDCDPVNLGTGREISIAELAALIARHSGFKGEIRWNQNRPDGQPRRRIDTSRAKDLLGWSATTTLDDGIAKTIAWWKQFGATSESRRSVALVR